MESCSIQKRVKHIKIYLYLRFFEVATLNLDDSFAHSWLSLNQLHEVVTWNAFQLTGVPWSKLFWGISILLNAFEPISCVVSRTLKVSSSAVSKKHQALWSNWLSWGTPQERKTQRYSALRKYSAPLNFATFCHISGFKHKRYKTVFFVKNQQQVGHNHEVERHLFDISNFFNKSKTEKLGVQNYSAPLS